MNNQVVHIQFPQFFLIYLLLILVLWIMQKSKISQTTLLIVATTRMSLQLVLAGLVLTFIFDNPHPLFSIAYILLMSGYAVGRVLHKNKNIPNQFKLGIIFSLGGAGIATTAYFIGVVIQKDIFFPQYAIPIAGMVMGASMTGVTLGVKTFREAFDGQRPKIDALINLGVHPREVLLPYVHQAIETAMLPTMNTMLGMGVISLPGMMTGQILSGTPPTTAIMYQIAITICSLSTTCLAIYGSLTIGYKSFYNQHNQIISIAQ